MQITSLNSGSNGNCYYIGNETDAVLIDAGLSCKETERRMYRLGLNMKNIKAIFVSHEHIDHVRGLAGLAEKYAMPVYVTEATQRGCYHLNPQYAKTFTEHKAIQIGSLNITAFSKAHDAADAHSFIVSSNKITIGIFTDIGLVCQNLIQYFKQCHAVFLEANYDDAMLANGKYPAFLKQRISGGVGHLSNTQAIDLFLKHKHKELSHLILAHLSKENNCPNLVQQLFEQHAGNIKILVASRESEMEMIHLANNAIASKKKNIKHEMQLSFAF